MSKTSVSVALETLGCKLNQAETESLSRQLMAAGCTLVPPEQAADIYILNTCSVTHVADAKARHLLRQMHRRNPNTRIVAAGCYAESGRLELERLGGIDLIVDNTQKPNLVRLLKDRGFLTASGAPLLQKAPQRTRSFIRAQDGCTNFCTYCIVPSVRGPEKSLAATDVIGQIRQRVYEGYREVVLTGTEIGRYRDAGCDLTGLLTAILEATQIARLRLSSLQPQEVSEQLLELWQNPRLCPHFHLSLQSGSDTVLSRMNRHYSSSRYREAVELIRSRIPGPAITTDLIVGFPAESDGEFAASREFCRSIGFARMHLFPYSPRQGTPASKISPQIEAAVKRDRAQQMQALARASAAAFNFTLMGQTLPVLFEQKTGAHWTGLTANYVRVSVDSDRDLTNQILNVRLLKVRSGGVSGELVMPLS